VNDCSFINNDKIIWQTTFTKKYKYIINLCFSENDNSSELSPNKSILNASQAEKINLKFVRREKKTKVQICVFYFHYLTHFKSVVSPSYDSLLHSLDDINNIVIGYKSESLVTTGSNKTVIGSETTFNTPLRSEASLLLEWSGGDTKNILIGSEY
jgi:hypothetical protein